MSKSKKRAKGPKPGYVRITMDYPHTDEGPWLRGETSGSFRVLDQFESPPLGELVSLKWNKEDRA